MKVFIIIFFLLLHSFAFAQSKVAIVKLIRGDVDLLISGKSTKLKVDEWVEKGAVIRTADKSFVKLIFIDKSQMNVGPNSEMRIESFSGKDSGVIDLVKGKIRSQVTKDYLQIQDKGKSKLFIKTQNAVMGVRGTDFLIATNGASTSAILFEGEIVFNKLEVSGTSDPSQLEDAVNRGVRIHPGEFSVMDQDRSLPTVPALLNLQQREQLEKNQEFNLSRSPSNSEPEVTKSVVPTGLLGEVVANNSETLKTEVALVIKNDPKSVTDSSDPAGFIKGDSIKPANGSFVHVDSGVIIPPGPGSVLDKNTNTFIPGPDSGKVSIDGAYIPPKNVEITDSGKVLVTVTDSSGTTKVVEVKMPAPVLAPTSFTLTQTITVIQANPTIVQSGSVTTNDILNASFAPSGVTDLSNLRLNQTGGVTSVNDPVIRLPGPKTDTTITVNP